MLMFYSINNNNNSGNTPQNEFRNFNCIEETISALVNSASVYTFNSMISSIPAHLHIPPLRIIDTN